MKTLAYDTETTGLPDWNQPTESPQQPHLVEIAALLFNGMAEIDRFHAIVRPDGWTIPDEVAEIHGITTERDAVAYAFKAHPAYCTSNKAKPLMKLPPTPKMLASPRFRNSFKQPNLQEAHQHFIGEAFDGAHGALADAEACARVYFALLSRPGAAA